MKKITLGFGLFISVFSFGQVSTNKAHDAIVEEFLHNCAEKHNYTIEMSEWQDCLDQGLKKDSTVAYLWQQKAMPYFKCKKYEVGMPYLKKAVLYDKERWLSYRAFMKCIFSRDYKDAIIDFDQAIKLYGNSYVMDHSFGFYKGLCYLQLNEYEKAEKLFDDYVNDIYKNRQQLEHPTAYFYQGIAKYELKKWDEAIAIFDKALKIYPEFSDAKVYKAICWLKQGKPQEEVMALINIAKDDAKKGFSINEDNAIYETYPYQMKFGK
ncbi:tetratricopeptide (TPR) repeat protein [Flavobacterium sp. HSC-32F16]|uniref:tetratricopeptide repeat protein n=1 Tax=Flavobacterium sp. HSC-32F16 TaxID=2910964 RepID=UPI0020A285AA|nr:tetratricopeptide repeat protein [Flavobacterium sp. HSC-32F16]MCP2026311.1 tetratricopeptide (TPR) repeat protein [Flavobacterium sp. HSC-32F16]